MPARLIAESGSAAPRILDLADTAVVFLGRSRDNDVVLHDRHASRRHARLSSTKGRWTLTDQETTNGTRVNGQLIHGETPLEHGQQVEIGGVRLRFQVLNGHAGQDEDTFSSDPELVIPPGGSMGDSTVFQPDELTALVQFMKSANDAAAHATPSQLVTLALQTLLHQAGASMVGFDSLDADAELRLILPEQAAEATFHRSLSRQLTQRVQREGRMVWLCSPRGRTQESDSLSNVHDAICIPLHARGAGSRRQPEPPLGALHVYRYSQPFTERQAHFCEALASTLASALHQTRSRLALEADNSRLRERRSSGSSEELVGRSQPMAALRRQISRLAGSNCTVLVVGESGTGKELVALGLHHQSPRHRGPLVPVNCAAINHNMAESELFGHVKGAFTGALRDHRGYFGQADMGTLFLDEIGELSPDLQAKLLRAIESKCIRPVGARQETRVDVRIIAATNRNLEREVQDGKFRRDLYFRLTSRIVLQPLRGRLEDVPELVDHFLELFNAEARTNVTISEAALERLKSYHWPGNVRQLRAVLEGAMAMACDTGVIHADDLNLPEGRIEPVAERPPTLNLEDLERWAIRHALEQTGWNNTQAAPLLGIHRTTLIEKMKRYRIERG